ncbi:MAG: hypothetical protein KAJ95_07860 [Gammaproteobacteria bacterium]|nr:hypothetical protein [Gammaproteobacteria bacterium]
MKEKNDNNTELARRRLLKTIAGAGGVITAGKMLPDTWKRPIVDAALLPAHAQTSTCTEACSLDIVVTWNTNVDLDLLLETPGGTTIDPKSTLQSQCLQHNGDDDGTVSPYTETISTIGSGVNPGTYRMFVRNPTGSAQTINYTISGCGNDIAFGLGIGSTPLYLVNTFTVPGS